MGLLSIGFMPVRAVLERGPKERKVVAYAVDWPGWTRGAKTAELALARLENYRERYRPVAVAAKLKREFDAAGPLEVVEDMVGMTSTDFWGFSFVASSLEKDPMHQADLDRKIALLRGCWSVFDEVAASVSAELDRGPRGTGRDRDQIIRHTLRSESEQTAKKLGLRIAERTVLEPKALHEFRDTYVATMRAYNDGEVKRMRSWTLAFLIRHTAFHLMDHAWEMQDKDLTPK